MNFSTFNNSPETFEEAIRYHALVDRKVKEFCIRDIKKRLPIAEEVWDVISGKESDETQTVASAVELSMPIEVALTLQRCKGSRSFAFESLIDELKDLSKFDDAFEIHDRAEKAWHRFEARRRAASNVEYGLGCDESSGWQMMVMIADMPHSEFLQGKVEKIAQLAGRMFKAMNYSTKKVECNDPQEVRGSTIGRDVERLLPAEMARLASPMMKDYQSMRILKGQAQQFAMKGWTPGSRGPMVIAIDNSGSMNDDRNTWAKAVSVALTRIAWIEDRAVRVVHFDSSTYAQDLPKGDSKAMFEMMVHFSGGGTYIAGALNRSIEEVGDLEAQGKKGADIVLITDGEDYNQTDINLAIDRMDASEIKLFTVSIGQDLYKESPVRVRASHYVHAHDRVLVTQQGADLADQLTQAALDPKEIN